jgi:hypothetical protein
MSLKATFFQTALKGFAPANVYKWRLLIDAPRIMPVSLMDLFPFTVLCKSATIPQKTRMSVQVPVKGGNVIEYPGMMQMSGDFTFSCYEGQDGVVRHYAEILQQMSNIQENDGMAPLFDATLTQLQGPMNVNMPDVKLKGCFIKSRGPVTMDSSQATTPLTWDMTMHYNRIVEEYTGADLPVVMLAKITGAYGIARAATFAGGASVLTADPTGLSLSLI